MSGLVEKHAADGLVVLAVNAWDDEAGIVRRFVKRGKLKQRVLLKGGSVAKTYGVKSVPTTLWIDREGRIVDTDLGFDKAGLMEKTQRLIAGNR